MDDTLPLWLGSGDVLSKGQYTVFIIVRYKVIEIGKPGGVISSEAERHITHRSLSVKIEPLLSSCLQTGHACTSVHCESQPLLASPHNCPTPVLNSEKQLPLLWANMPKRQRTSKQKVLVKVRGYVHH